MQPIDSELDDLARQIGKLRPDWKNAETFYELRSEIIGALRRIARSPHAPIPRVLVRERVRVVTRIIVLPRHLHRPPKRHRYPRPPSNENRQTHLPLIDT